MKGLEVLVRIPAEELALLAPVSIPMKGLEVLVLSPPELLERKY